MNVPVSFKMRLGMLAFVATTLAVLSGPARAQDYPTRVVHVIAPFGPGGPADIFSRVVAQKLSDTLKQGFVVENRPGASTMIGTDAVAKAAPDGHTLLIISQTHATNESLVANKPFQLMRDFAPVSPIYAGDLVMVVHKSVPVKTLKDFIALAKAKPGTMNYASSGTGSQYHLTGELFKTMSGTDIVHVPYKSSTGARNDILGGQVEMMFDTIATMGPSVEASLVRALGTTGQERSPNLPDVPTISEAGVPGFQASGMASPKESTSVVLSIRRKRLFNARISASDTNAEGWSSAIKRDSSQLLCLTDAVEERRDARAPDERRTSLRSRSVQDTLVRRNIETLQDWQSSSSASFRGAAAKRRRARNP